MIFRAIRIILSVNSELSAKMMQLRDSLRRLAHHRSMRLKQPLGILFMAAAFVLWSGSLAYGGAATNIGGLYYTGVSTTFSPLPGGTAEPSWQVTYADVAGTSYKSTYSLTGNPTTTAYTGDAYVINPSIIAGQNYIQNSNSAQWITAPGASTATTGGTLNAGGNYLPGNGNTNGAAPNNNEGIYVYTLAFTISGYGGTGSTVSNAVTISLTLAADDQYSVYVNPTLNGNGSINTGASTLGGSNLFSGTNQPWTNTQSLVLQNGTGGNNGNAHFVIGTNYLVIEVDNTNSILGSSPATDLNASGLLVYQVGAAMTVGGNPVPEVGAWLPVLGALGLLVWYRWRRRSGTASLV
jgi:hypothetical protein